MLIPGFDKLVSEGINRGSIILISGGCGTGKTTFTLHSLYEAAKNGERCLYITLEQPPKTIRENAEVFGWNIKKLESEGKMLIIYADPVQIQREVQAALMKGRGDLLVKTKGLLGFLPKGFEADRIVIDSMSVLEAVFSKREEDYRVYLGHLVKGLRDIGATSYLVTESESPEKYTRSGIEEFVADGVFLIYYMRRGNTRTRAMEILKLRGSKHSNRIVPFDITNTGIIIHPDAELFAEILSR